MYFKGGWLGSSLVKDLAAELEVLSSIPPLGLKGEEPAWVALGKLHTPNGAPRGREE